MSTPDPQPGSSFPVAPAYTAEPPYGAATTPVERPASLTRAVQLMYVGAVLGLVGVIAAWATKGALRDQLETAGTSLTSSELDTAVTIALATATVIGLIGVGLWLWMAAANKAGKSWARVLGTVFGGLNIVSVLLSLANSTGVTIALQLVSVALAVTILVLLWRPASSAYYKARSARA